MSTEPTGYFAGLIRLWQVESTGDQQWRASIEEVTTGVRLTFATPELMFAYVQDYVRSERSTPFGPPTIAALPDNSP